LGSGNVHVVAKSGVQSIALDGPPHVYAKNRKRVCLDTSNFLIRQPQAFSCTEGDAKVQTVDPGFPRAQMPSPGSWLRIRARSRGPSGREEAGHHGPSQGRCLVLDDSSSITGPTPKFTIDPGSPHLVRPSTTRFVRAALTDGTLLWTDRAIVTSPCDYRI